MLLLIALGLIAGIALISALAYVALNRVDEDLALSRTSIVVWRRRRNFIAVILLGGITVILATVGLLGDRISA